MMDHIIASSAKSLRSLTTKITSLKLKYFNGENAGQAVSFVRGDITMLDNNDALPKDIDDLIFTIFKGSSTDDFETCVSTMSANQSLKLLNLDRETILDMIQTRYNDLVGRNEWKVTTSRGRNQLSIQTTAKLCAITVKKLNTLSQIVQKRKRQVYLDSQSCYRE